MLDQRQQCVARGSVYKMREDLEAPFPEIEHANRDGRGVERLFERTRDALGRRFVCRDAPIGFACRAREDSGLPPAKSCMARKLRRPRHPQANLDVVEAYCVCAFALGAVKADCLPKQTLVADSCLHGAPAGTQTSIRRCRRGRASPDRLCSRSLCSGRHRRRMHSRRGLIGTELEQRRWTNAWSSPF